MNLLKETISELEDNNKTEKDVLWVGCKYFYTTWEHFKSIADVEYYDGYGGQEVAPDLLVVGDNWWLERHEYDGSEWWKFKELPKKPDERFDFNKVKDEECLFNNLPSINEREIDEDE